MTKQSTNTLYTLIIIIGLSIILSVLLGSTNESFAVKKVRKVVSRKKVATRPKLQQAVAKHNQAKTVATSANQAAAKATEAAKRLPPGPAKTAAEANATKLQTEANIATAAVVTTAATAGMVASASPADNRPVYVTAPPASVDHALERTNQLAIAAGKLNTNNKHTQQRTNSAALALNQHNQNEAILAGHIKKTNLHTQQRTNSAAQSLNQHNQNEAILAGHIKGLKGSLSGLQGAVSGPQPGVMHLADRSNKTAHALNQHNQNEAILAGHIKGLKGSLSGLQGAVSGPQPGVMHLADRSNKTAHALNQHNQNEAILAGHIKGLKNSLTGLQYASSGVNPAVQGTISGLQNQVSSLQYASSGVNPTVQSSLSRLQGQIAGVQYASSGVNPAVQNTIIGLQNQVNSTNDALSVFKSTYGPAMTSYMLHPNGPNSTAPPLPPVIPPLLSYGPNIAEYSPYDVTLLSGKSFKLISSTGQSLLDNNAKPSFGIGPVRTVGTPFFGNLKLYQLLINNTPGNCVYSINGKLIAKQFDPNSDCYKVGSCALGDTADLFQMLIHYTRGTVILWQSSPFGNPNMRGICISPNGVTAAWSTDFADPKVLEYKLTFN